MESFLVLIFLAADMTFDKFRVLFLDSTVEAPSAIPPMTEPYLLGWPYWPAIAPFKSSDRFTFPSMSKID